VTFDNAAWAINGATLGSSLARRAQFAAVEGFEGIVQDGDLKVTQLDVPGVGIQIAPGAAVILNRYQTTPNEAYTVSNPGVHTITSGEMPPANPAAKSYLVAVVVGDPDFSQVGHPWMGADDPPAGEETTFDYVRVTIIEVAAGTKSAKNLGFPALALARIDVPANTTTITNAMITDLRALAQPRSKQVIVQASGPGTPHALSGQSLVRWPNTAFWNVEVPEWATKVSVIANLEGVSVTKAGSGILVARMGTTSVANINLNETGPAVTGYTLGGTTAVPLADRGTTKTFELVGSTTNTASNGLVSMGGTGTVFFAITVEEAIV